MERIGRFGRLLAEGEKGASRKRQASSHGEGVSSFCRGRSRCTPRLDKEAKDRVQEVQFKRLKTLSAVSFQEVRIENVCHGVHRVVHRVPHVATQPQQEGLAWAEAFSRATSLAALFRRGEERSGSGRRWAWVMVNWLAVALADAARAPCPAQGTVPLTNAISPMGDRICFGAVTR